jgi:hypothetical protein
MILHLLPFKWTSYTGQVYQDRIEEIMQALEDLAIGWTLTQSGTYSSGTASFGIATHDDGAQWMMIVGSANIIHTDNSYDGGTGNTNVLRMAFKPSLSGASFATVSGAVNPHLTSTYVADAGSFLFKQGFDWNSGVNFMNNGRLFMLADEESAFLSLLGHNEGGQRKWYLFADDAVGAPNWEDMFDPADTDKAIALYFLTGTPTDGTSVTCEFHKGVTIYKSAVFATKMDQLGGIDYPLGGLEPIDRFKVLESTIVCKGILDHRVIAAMRDAGTPELYRVKLDANLHYVHRDATDSGLMIWPADEPFAF